MENKERVFCGNAKIITTQYGEMTKISFSASDLEKLQNSLENGWVNTVLKAKKTPVEGKPTHYLEVDTWKPEAKAEPIVSGGEAIVSGGENKDDLPF